MTQTRFIPPLKEGGQPSILGFVGAVDPTYVHSKLMLRCWTQCPSRTGRTYT